MRNHISSTCRICRRVYDDRDIHCDVDWMLAACRCVSHSARSLCVVLHFWNGVRQIQQSSEEIINSGGLAQGRTLLTAQRVCEHTYHYDGLGRPIHDCVCAFNLYKLINLRSRPGPDIALGVTSPLPKASGQLDAHLNSLMLRKQHDEGQGETYFTMPKQINSTGRPMAVPQSMSRSRISHAEARLLIPRSVRHRSLEASWPSDGRVSGYSNCSNKKIPNGAKTRVRNRIRMVGGNGSVEAIAR